MYSFQNHSFKNDSLGTLGYRPTTSIITMTIITPLGFFII